MVKCPKCGSELVRRCGVTQFVGCKNYPSCDFTAALNKFSSEELKQIKWSYNKKGYCLRCNKYTSVNGNGLCSVCQENV